MAMKVREGLSYLKTHQWMKEEGDQVVIGITDYAQAQLQTVIFVNLPEKGVKITAGKPFAEVESVKVVSDVHSPVSGIVSEVNEELLDEPERINEDPYEMWLIKVKNVTQTAQLLSATDYKAWLETLQNND